MSALSPRDWLLLLFLEAPKAIDRVRIQKALFLFAKRSNAPEDQKYDFEPYNYGPFSFQIYPDLGSLVSGGALRAESVPWMNTPLYAVTDEGSSRAREIAEIAPPKRLRLLHDMRAYVIERDFNTLLRDVYRLYPEFATRSVFRS